MTIRRVEIPDYLVDCANLRAAVAGQRVRGSRSRARLIRGEYLKLGEGEDVTVTEFGHAAAKAMRGIHAEFKIPDWYFVHDPDEGAPESSLDDIL